MKQLMKKQLTNIDRPERGVTKRERERERERAREREREREKERPERGVTNSEEAELILEADARSNRCTYGP
jgi:hypothetical protein